MLSKIMAAITGGSDDQSGGEQSPSGVVSYLCGNCNGCGRDASGNICPVCNGSGINPDAEKRRLNP